MHVHGKPLRISADASNVSTGASSAAAAIPDNANGETPEYVLLACSGDAYFKPGQSGVSVTPLNGTLITSASPMILHVKGQTHIAHLQRSTSQALSITPLENG